MKITRNELKQLADRTGFRAEPLERVIRLVGLLNRIFQDVDLRDRLVLKGGAALNLFDPRLPRLSMDIDLNFLGPADRECLDADRPWVEARLHKIVEKEGYVLERAPDAHAGGKWSLFFLDSAGAKGRVSMDINYMHRVLLRPLRILDSAAIGPHVARQVPVLCLL